MADEEADDTPPIRPEVDWASLPETFDVAYVRKMKIRDRLQLDKHGDEHLTESQMASYRAAANESMPAAPINIGALTRANVQLSKSFPKVNVMPPSTSRAFTGVLGPQFGFKDTANAAMARFKFRPPPSTHLNLARVAAEQAEATKRLIEATQAPIAPVPRINSQSHLDEISQALEAKRVERDRKDEIDEQRASAVIELLGVTSASTSALVENAEVQERRITSQAVLTNVLSLAVVYDVANGTFDDHTIWTTLISASTSVVLVLAANLIGGKVARRRHHADSADE